MVRIDENQEAIALIRMAIDNNTKAHTEAHEMDLGGPELERHWTFGSPNGTQLDSRELERILSPSDRNFTSFDDRLRLFIVDNFPDEALRYEDIIYVCVFQSKDLHST